MSLSLIAQNQNIRIAFVGSYPDLSHRLEAMVKQLNVSLKSYYAEFEDAVTVAKEIEDSVDVIISRGMASEFIRAAVKVPVVNIPVGPFDLILALENAEDLPERVAFLNHGRKLYGIDAIERRHGIKIEEYVVLNPIDTKNSVRMIHESGVPLLIGGNVSVNLANELGMKGIEISAGSESIYNALLEAIHLVQAGRMEKNRSEWMKATLNSLSEGIVVEDKNGQVVMHNTTAVKLLNLGRGLTDGISIEDVLPDDILRRTGMERGGDSFVRTCGPNKIACNTIPVRYNNEYVATVRTFEDVTRIQILEKQVRAELRKKGFVAKWNFENICTVSSSMLEAIELAKLYSRSNSSILISGESGTGKEMMAQSIHNSSPRRDGPFVAINCAALPESLLESELFGYEGGAFSGAKKEGHAGLFEMAHNGTIFLDEIGELPLSFQSKLLRAIQEKEIIRVGGNRVIPVDIRIISATNRDLLKETENGNFRQDLYYRLNVLKVHIPPLRERKDDIVPLLKNYFSAIMEDKLFTTAELESVAAVLTCYDWPGNVRELYNFAERIMLYKTGQEMQLDTDTIPRLLDSSLSAAKKACTLEDGLINLDLDISGGLKASLEQAERIIIDKVSELCEGDQQKILRTLNIGKTTLWRKKENSGKKDEI